MQNDFRSVRNARNKWMIDREVQKRDTFSGITGINAQDRAVQESMGKIVDRSQEHLGAADKAIIATRRLLEQAVRDVQEGGQPIGVAASYYNLRAMDRILPNDADWHAQMLDIMYPTTPAATVS